MDILEAREEYIKAKRLAEKEVRELRQASKPTTPAVLDDIIGQNISGTPLDIGLVNILQIRR